MTARPAAWFASARERRLWVWTLAIVTGIYSTLVLAERLAGQLRDRDLLDSAFVAGALLTVLAVVALAMKARPGGAEIGVGLGVAAVYLVVFARLGIPAAERTHLVEYGVVAAFVYEALLERARQGRALPAPAPVAVAAASALGALDEGIQAVLPSRVFDPIDIGFNVLAATLAVAAFASLRWARERTQARRRG